jgi:hypothetical protein
MNVVQLIHPPNHLFVKFDPFLDLQSFTIDRVMKLNCLVVILQIFEMSHKIVGYGEHRSDWSKSRENDGYGQDNADYEE